LAPRQLVYRSSSTTISLQTFGLPTFGLLPHLSVWGSHTSNFCFSKSLFSSIQTSTYTMIPFYQSASTDTMIIQHTIMYIRLEWKRQKLAHWLITAI